MSRTTIFLEIENERKYQEERWGNVVDDTKNQPNDFVSYISHHATRWLNGGFAPYPKPVVSNFRQQMIKVAALAVAAIESLDRQRATNGRTFYEN